MILSWCDIRAKLQLLVSTIFSGWLQTKVVEDVFQDARRRESHDVGNKHLKISSYYAQISEAGVIGEHGRQEIKAKDDEPKAEGNTKHFFHSDQHEPSIPNAEEITGHCDWQTFSAQSARTIYADQFIIRSMYLSPKWEMASKCWQARLVPRRSVVKLKSRRGEEDVYLMVLGVLALKVVLGWKLEVISIPRSKFKIFLIGAGRVANHTPTAFTVIDLADISIIPSTVISPLNYFLIMKRQCPDRIGVVLMQHGLPEHVHLAAARAAFYDLQLPQMKTLVSEYRVPSECITLPLTVHDCVKYFIHKHTGKHPTEQELRGILSLRCAASDDVCKGIADEDLLMELIDADDLKSFQDSLGL